MVDPVVAADFEVRCGKVLGVLQRTGRPLLLGDFNGLLGSDRMSRKLLVACLKRLKEAGTARPLLTGLLGEQWVAVQVECRECGTLVSRDAAMAHGPYVAEDCCTTCGTDFLVEG